MEKNIQTESFENILSVSEDKNFTIKNSHGLKIIIEVKNGIANSYEKRTGEKKYLPDNGIILNGLGNIIGFGFVIKDDKELLKVETEYMNYYFLENQEQYISQKFEGEKLKELIISNIDNILEYGIDKLNLPFIFSTQTTKGSDKEYLKFNKEK